MVDKIDIQALNVIINRMKDVVEKSKDEIFYINEGALKEHDYLLQELKETKSLVSQFIKRNDDLEKKVRLSKLRLSKVSSEFNRYSEEEIREVYETTHRLQTELIIAQQEEKVLRQKRDDLERRLLRLKTTIEHAENLGRKVSVILTYLEDDFSQVNEVIKSVKEKQHIGLKIIETQENERKRLSREIHDGPAQMLANILIRSEFVDLSFRECNLDNALQEMKSIRENIRSSLYEVRRIIYDLRPMALDDLGLIPTIKRHVSSMAERSKIPIKLVILGDEKRLESNYEIAIFRLVQEALQNAINHAKTKDIYVKVEMVSTQVNIIIKDGGVGFDTNEINSNSNSFGLVGMKERVDLLKGEISIESEINQGTTVKIKVPLDPT